MADSRPVPPRDPRLRPFRAALWAIYFLVILVPIALVVVSVVRNLRVPPRPQADETGMAARPSPRVCVQELEALNREQNKRAWALGEEIGQADALARYLAWSQDFERRVADLSDRCHLDGGPAYRGRAEVARARDAVLALHRGYRAQANRFAQEEAELAGAARAALAGARDVARQP